MIKRKLLGHESLENRQLLAACSPISTGTATAADVTPTFVCDNTIALTNTVVPTVTLNSATLTSGTSNGVPTFSGTLGLTVAPGTDGGTGSMTCTGTFSFSTTLPTATGYGADFSFANPYNTEISDIGVYTFSVLPAETGASGTVDGIVSAADSISAQWNVCSQFYTPYDSLNTGSSSSTVLLKTTNGFDLTTAGTGDGAGTSLGKVVITNVNGLGGTYIGNPAVNYKMFDATAVSTAPITFGKTFVQALLNTTTVS